MVLVADYLQVLAVGLQVDSLQLARLVIGLDVLIQAEVPQSREVDVRVVQGHEAASPRGKLRRIGQKLDLGRNFILMGQKF